MIITMCSKFGTSGLGVSVRVRVGVSVVIGEGVNVSAAVGGMGVGVSLGKTGTGLQPDSKTKTSMQKLKRGMEISVNMLVGCIIDQDRLHDYVHNLTGVISDIFIPQL
jgi:hypothetical protein